MLTSVPLGLLQEMREKAWQAGNAKLLEKVQALERLLFYVRFTLEAFKRSQGKIKGKQGTSEFLEMTRVGVYSRLQKLQLTTDQFRHPEATEEFLFAASPTIQKLLQDIRHLISAQPKIEK